MYSCFLLSVLLGPHIAEAPNALGGLGSSDDRGVVADRADEDVGLHSDQLRLGDALWAGWCRVSPQAKLLVHGSRPSEKAFHEAVGRLLGRLLEMLEVV